MTYVAAVAVGLAAALFVVLGIGLTCLVAIRRGGHLFHYLMLMVAGASIGTIVLSGRTLRLGVDGLDMGGGADIVSTISAKLLLAALVGASVSVCAAWLLRLPNSVHSNRFADRGFRAPRDILLSFVVYYVAFSILPIAFAEKFAFHISLVYPLFVFLALFLSLQIAKIDPADTVKHCLALIVLGSLLAGAIAPGLSVQPGYRGIAPGFDWRLWGVTASANSLGSVASALLVFESAHPSEQVHRRWLFRFGAASALVMTQSKTAIIAAIVGLAIVLAWRLLNTPRRQLPTNKMHGMVASAFAIALLAILVITAWSLLYYGPFILASVERSIGFRAFSELSTATGRIDIWAHAVQGGAESFLFGQGLDYWSEENRVRLGLTGAVHAHNLFLQAFSRAGIIGLGCLLVFLSFLIRYAFRAVSATQGGSVALLTVFLVRAIFEVPLSPNAILGAEFFSMMGLLVYVIDRGAAPLAASRERR